MKEASFRKLDGSRMDVSPVDRLVLGTVNAPWKRSVEADALATAIIVGPDNGWDGWQIHVVTFFSEVRPHLIREFADQHEIAWATVRQRYQEIREETAEVNLELEAAFDASEN
ncbi:hypothetical protein [Magnetospirillum fulvum]|uniref:Uncharacterized protein n=1 Tax=Magnetospirillum fulvum MGU-K5 TaxID=1316936 RepID=S9SAM5_MAGFU|nr:hypothetical protein [Magnetospirillum fulvum]EPY02957.1 hypothetical protein K678_03512 [Magnetospirillum fulvum MGU-K5]